MWRRFGCLLIVPLALSLCAGRAAAQGSSERAERTREWAKRLIERYDKDGNKMLDKDERATLRGKPAGADLNGDDVITLNELVTHLSSDASTPPRPTKPEPAKPEPAATTATASSEQPQEKPSERPSRRERSRNTEASRPKQESSQPAERRLTSTQERKSYRFKSAVERLPGGLPGWFSSRDTNQDGQVAMSEYSHSWTDRTAEEFCRLDLNNDGFITPSECRHGN